LLVDGRAARDLAAVEVGVCLDMDGPVTVVDAQSVVAMVPLGGRLDAQMRLMGTRQGTSAEVGSVEMRE
jgi:hypothetical protein